MSFVCPVCGFDGLSAAPWRTKIVTGHDRSSLEVWRTSHEICPCCGLEFGRDDWAGGDALRRAELHERWRSRWIKKGMPFLNESLRPADWDGAAQIQQLQRPEETQNVNQRGLI